MKLTIEEDPETIKRYAHIRPARGLGVRPCRHACPGSTRTCTLERGHRGAHVAHGRLRRVVAVWDGGKAPPSTASVPRAAESRARNRPRAGKPGGALQSLWKMAVRAAGSFEEIALLIFFLAFVWFAIDWMLLIMQ